MLADDLEDAGYQVSERRVWRLCRKAGIRSVISKRQRKYSPAGPPVHDDLVQRNFTADQPNQLWLTDNTLAPPERDPASPENALPVEAHDLRATAAAYPPERHWSSYSSPLSPLLNTSMVRVLRRPIELAQFRSKKFTQALERHGLVGSMGRVGAAGDNAAMESFFSLLLKNVLDRRWWTTRQELRFAIMTWLEGK